MSKKQVKVRGKLREPIDLDLLVQAFVMLAESLAADEQAVDKHEPAGQESP